jgi:outer membrane protein assembly factor BamB
MMRHSLLFVALLSLAGCGTVGKVSDTVGGWFGSNAPKPVELSDFKASASLSKAWETQVGEANRGDFAPDSDGQGVYAASSEGAVMRIDLVSGKTVWRINAGTRLTAGVGTGQGLVVAGTAKGDLLTWKAADGSKAWSVNLGAEITARPVVSGGFVYARTGDGRVFKVDAQDGKIQWAYSRVLPVLTLRSPAGVAVDSEVVYAGHPGGRLTALAQNNGAPVWEANVALPKGSTEIERIADVVGAPVVDGTLACAGAFQGRVACFDRGNGNLRWARDFSALRGIAIDGRALYAVDADAVVQAFDRNRGVSPWKQEGLKRRGISMPLAVSEWVMVGDYAGMVHLLKRDDGAFAARASTDGSAIIGQPLALSGTLSGGFVVQTAKGGLYAFKIQ